MKIINYSIYYIFYSKTTIAHQLKIIRSDFMTKIATIIFKKKYSLELNGETDYTWFFGSDKFVEGGYYTKLLIF